MKTSIQHKLAALEVLNRTATLLSNFKEPNGEFSYELKPKVTEIVTNLAALTRSIVDHEDEVRENPVLVAPKVADSDIPF